MAFLLWYLVGGIDCSIIVPCFLRLLKLHTLAGRKLDLLRGGGGLSHCDGVLDRGLNLHWNIPLMYMSLM